MKKSLDLNKIFNNKVLFILPILFSLAYFSFFFNSNYPLFLRGSFEILYSEIFICSFIYIFLITIVHFLLRKRVDKYNLFLLKIIIFMLTIELSLVLRIVVSIVCIIAILLKNNLNKICVYLISYVICCLFIANFVPATFRTLMFELNTKSFDGQKEIVVTNYEDGPNIYWIHCDGMVSLATAEKYFDVDGTYLRDYFTLNDYYTNEDAELVAAHHTMQALVAMYNPYYYDEFFKEYLLSIEETYYNKDAKVLYYVDYSDLLERRLNNELFEGLNKSGYEIATITEFNQYSGFYADYIYDYDNMNVDPKKQLDLKYFNSSNTTTDMIDRYIALEHFEIFTKKTVFDNFINNDKVFNYEVLDYKNYNFEDYKYISTTDFWKSRAIVRSLEHLNTQTDNKRFVFIDYAINHSPWAYEIDGSFRDDYNSKEALVSTYTHSMYVLTDLLDYIRNNDPNAVIIVQGDHGVHYINGVSFYGMSTYFGVSEDEMRILRNSTINAVYIPEEYRTSDDEVLRNPLNISRYLINNYVGENYKYIE